MRRERRRKRRGECRGVGGGRMETKMGDSDKYFVSWKHSWVSPYWWDSVRASQSREEEETILHREGGG